MVFGGKSLLEFVPDFTVIDLETTGRGIKCGQITELSAIRYRNYIPVDAFSTLVKAHDPILPFVKTLTGISDEMIDGAPDIFEVIDAYIDFIGEDILVGHNVNFDLSLVGDAHYQLNSEVIRNNYLDTLRLSRIINKDSVNHKLETLCHYFGVSRVVGHRGLADCEQTGQIYVLMKEKAMQLKRTEYECV